MSRKNDIDNAYDKLTNTFYLQKQPFPRILQKAILKNFAELTGKRLLYRLQFLANLQAWAAISDVLGPYKF